MKFLILAGAFSVGFLSAMSPAHAVPVSDFLRGKTWTYQVRINRADTPTENSYGNMVLCKQGVIANDLVQDSRAQYNYQGHIRVEYQKSIVANVEVTAPRDDRPSQPSVALRAFYFPPSVRGMGAGWVYGSAFGETALENSLVAAGAVVEDGMVVQDPIRGTKTQFHITMITNFNPKMNCAYFEAQNH